MAGKQGRKPQSSKAMEMLNLIDKVKIDTGEHTDLRVSCVLTDVQTFSYCHTSQLILMLIKVNIGNLSQKAQDVARITFGELRRICQQGRVQAAEVKYPI